MPFTQKRQMMRIDPFFIGGQDGFVDSILQLTDVSGPRIPKQSLLRLRREIEDVDALFVREFGQQEARQRDNVLRSFAQRRYVDGNDGDAEVKIVAEPVSAHHRLQLLIGR